MHSSCLILSLCIALLVHFKAILHDAASSFLTPLFALRVQPCGFPTAAPRRLVVSQSISNRRLALCPRMHVDAWPYCVRVVKSDCNCYTIPCTAPALKCLGGYPVGSTAPAHTPGGEPPMPNLIFVLNDGHNVK